MKKKQSRKKQKMRVKRKTMKCSRRSVPEMLLISLNCHENKFNLTTRNRPIDHRLIIKAFYSAEHKKLGAIMAARKRAKTLTGQIKRVS
mgnify:CR=1 FL=1